MLHSVFFVEGGQTWTNSPFVEIVRPSAPFWGQQSEMGFEVEICSLIRNRNFTSCSSDFTCIPKQMCKICFIAFQSQPLEKMHPTFINPHHSTQVNTGMQVPVAGGSHCFTHQLSKMLCPQKLPPTNRFFLHKNLAAHENPNLSHARLNLWPSTVTVSARSMPCRAVDVKAKPNPHAASTWKCASSEAAKSLIKDSKVMAATTSIAMWRFLCNALFAQAIGISFGFGFDCFVEKGDI